MRFDLFYARAVRHKQVSYSLAGISFQTLSFNNK